MARDPGPIPDPKSEDVGGGSGGSGGGGGGGGDEMSIEDALLSTAPPSDDYTHPGRWCRICWRPKPERAHHCSQCGRCVLKMGAYPLSVLLSTRTHCTHDISLSSPHGTSLLDHHCPWMGAKCIVRHRSSLLDQRDTAPAPPWSNCALRAVKLKHCSAGLPDVPLFHSLPRIRHIPGSVRLCGMHSRARLRI